MEDKIKSQNKKLICSECKNQFDTEEAKISDIIECPHCGIEYEVKKRSETDEIEVEIIEEEK